MSSGMMDAPYSVSLVFLHISAPLPHPALWHFGPAWPKVKKLVKIPTSKNTSIRDKPRTVSYEKWAQQPPIL